LSQKSSGRSCLAGAGKTSRRCFSSETLARILVSPWIPAPAPTSLQAKLLATPAELPSPARETRTPEMNHRSIQREIRS